TVCRSCLIQPSIINAHCTCPLHLFFFYCSRPHRDLHSFPTRRSSDLDGTAAHTPRDGDQRRIARGREADGREVLRLVLLQRDDLDRKSTRLNSSHRTISYAVFCLKKKKKNNIQETNSNQKQ